MSKHLLFLVPFKQIPSNIQLYISFYRKEASPPATNDISIPATNENPMGIEFLYKAKPEDEEEDDYPKDTQVPQSFEYSDLGANKNSF